MFTSPNENPAHRFLRHATETRPVALFRAYAHYLLDSIEGWHLPVPIDAIMERHRLRVKKAPLAGQRGFVYGNKIVVNSDDLVTTQAFSLAHELMELLVAALRDETPSRFASHIQQKFDAEKEDWCEQGAAELLMPEPLFAPLAATHGVSLEAGCQVASICQTSLTAAVRRLVDSDLRPCIFALLKEGHSKTQVVPSRTGQGVLWGQPEDWDPPAELRVWRSWRAPQVNHYLPQNKSIPRTTTVYETLEARTRGTIRRGSDSLDIDGFPRQVETESMLVNMDGRPVVLAMVHL